VEAAILKFNGVEQEETFLCRKDVARILKVSLVTISAWTKSGKIPYHRIGSRVYFMKSEILKIFENKNG
jgi:excisionase family DNA binding protein